MAWLATVSRVVVIEVGASVAISSVRLFGEQIRERLIRINPQQAGTPFGGVGLAISGLQGIRILTKCYGS